MVFVKKIVNIQGRVWKFGDNVNSEAILPSPYLGLHDVKKLAEHCMEGIDNDFSLKVRTKDIIVAGDNFGCGSSREKAVLAILGCKISCVIAKSFARIFFRNAINNGLLVFEIPILVDNVRQGTVIKIDRLNGVAKIKGNESTYSFEPYSEIIQSIIKNGGLIPFVSANLLTEKERENKNGK